MEQVCMANFRVDFRNIKRRGHWMVDTCGPVIIRLNNLVLNINMFGTSFNPFRAENIVCYTNFK